MRGLKGLGTLPVMRVAAVAGTSGSPEMSPLDLVHSTQPSGSRSAATATPATSTMYHCTGSLVLHAHRGALAQVGW